MVHENDGLNNPKLGSPKKKAKTKGYVGKHRKEENKVIRIGNPPKKDDKK